jgi:hypothetical protein
MYMYYIILTRRHIFFSILFSSLFDVATSKSVFFFSDCNLLVVSNFFNVSYPLIPSYSSDIFNRFLFFFFSLTVSASSSLT